MMIKIPEEGLVKKVMIDKKGHALIHGKGNGFNNYPLNL